MCFGGGDYGAGDAERLYQQQQMRVGGAMNVIDQAFAGYNKDFYNKRAADYVKAYMPDVQEQYRTTKDALGFKLADQGLTKSSAGGRLGDLLAREFSKQKMALADQGTAAAQQLQQQIEKTRGGIVSQVEQSVDPAAAATSALNTAASFAPPSIAAPMANMTGLFGNWAAQYLQANLGGSSAFGVAPTTFGGYGANPPTPGGYNYVDNG